MTDDPIQRSKNNGIINGLMQEWNFSKKVITKVVNYFNSYDSANDYLDIMSSITETENPADAWEDYLQSMRGFVSMEEENPFKN